MKLIYMPGACSLAPHIVAREAGISLDLLKLDRATKKLSDGRDYLPLNSKGYVPALELDDGQVLTEAAVVMQYLADRNPAAALIPACGTLERYRVLELLGYITSEIHKTYGPLFNPQILPAVREERIAYLQKRYALLEELLASRPFLAGAQFTIADAYLFVVTRWAARLKVDLGAFPKLNAFQETIAARPAVQAAMQAEGLS